MSYKTQITLQAVNNMLYLIHWNACAYYAISEYEGIGSNNFVYDGQVKYSRHPLLRGQISFVDCFLLVYQPCCPVACLPPGQSRGNLMGQPTKPH